MNSHSATSNSSSDRYMVIRSNQSRLAKRRKRLQSLSCTTQTCKIPEGSLEGQLNASQLTELTPTSEPKNYLSSTALGPVLDLESTMRVRSLRHQNHVRKPGMRQSLKLIYKYRARSRHELYDLCTSEEWADLIYLGDDYVKNINIALELFIKDCLEIQRRNRWEWFLSFQKVLPEEEREILNIFSAQGIDFQLFCDSLKCVLLEQHKKKNSIKIWGKPDSCKTLIARLICDVFVSCYANNHGSELEFFFSNFLSKSIINCEELFATPATAEDLKSILSGRSIDISKKYQEKQSLIRTPIIITSNYEKFGRGLLPLVDENALNNRCFVFHFNRQYTPKCTVTSAALAHLCFIYDNKEMI